jgi:hypothetical protein
VIYKLPEVSKDNPLGAAKVADVAAIPSCSIP